VSFAGARHFSRDFLEAQLASYLIEELPGSRLAAPVDSEVVDELWNGQPTGRRRVVPAPPITNPELLYYGPAYKNAIEHIVELYRGDGFLSARVGPAQIERIGKNRSAVLIPVVEGPRTLVHEVTLRGAEALSQRDILLAAQLQKDQPFSYLLLEQARRRVLEAYQERGYMFATCEAHVRFSGDRTRAEVELQVIERFAVHIRQIVVQGADRTDESLIRRVLRFAPGDLFRPSLARASERELSMLQVFSGISITLKEPELASRVKTVLVTVSERRNQFLGFSAGVSTGQGVRAGFEYGYRNLFGQAVGLSLRTQFAYQPFFVDPVIQKRFDALSVSDRLERRISLGTTIPRLPGLGRVRTSLDLVHLRSNERDFGISQYATGLTFTHATTEHLTLTLGGDLENNRVDLFIDDALDKYLMDPRLRRLLRVSEDKVLPPRGSATLIAARTSLSYDRRDSAFTPTRGFFVSTSVELARTLSSERRPVGDVDEFFSRFVKLSITGSGYISIGAGVVLAGQARIGRIVHLHRSSKTYPTRAFFLGGVDSLRGYLEDELIPQDIAEVENLDPNAIVRSGDAFVLYRGELRFPLYGEWRGGLFTDLGNLWADASNLALLNLRPTAGIGLRLDTPVGPLALDCGINLNRRRHERSMALHFAIGLF
jgi:outer membrane protein assembly complex protein YaeT